MGDPGKTSVQSDQRATTVKVVVATTVMLVGSIFTPWAVVWGTPPIAVTLIGWFWPKDEKEDVD